MTAFLAIYWLFLRKETFFRFNRFYLILGAILSFVLPFYVFKYTVEIVPIPINIVSSAPAKVVDKAAFDWINIAYIAYLVGIMVVLAASFVEIKRVWTLLRSGQIVHKNGLKFVKSARVPSPFSAFGYIFLGKNGMQDSDSQTVISHERTHAVQLHWVDLVLIKMVCALQWFNPFAWLCAKYIKDNHEYLADEAVLHQGISRSAYVSVLLKYSVYGQTSTLTNSFTHYNNNLKRLKMMKKHVSKPIKKWAVLLMLPISVVIFTAFSAPKYVEKATPKADKRVPQTIEKASVKANKGIVKVEDIDNSKVLYVVDGKEVESIDDVDANTINDIEVLKDKLAVEKYGEKGKDGVIVVTTKGKIGKVTTADERVSKLTVENGNYKVSAHNNDAPTVEKMSVTLDKEAKGDNVRIVKTGESDTANPLLLVNGEEMSREEFNAINSSDIESVSVLKDSSAKAYGDKGKNGVILVTMKKGEK